MLRYSSLLAAICFLIARPAAAFELGAEGSPLSVDVHAFASQGFILTTNNNYLADNTTHGSFQFSEIGINFTKSITDKMRLGLQLFAQDLGPSGNFNAKMDWFYFDYRWRDWLGFRAGRVKIPFGLYNEINDIDAARVAILLPQSVYPVSSRDFLLAQTGVELYGYARTRRAGALDYRLYGGTIFFDTLSLVRPGGPYQVVDLNAPYVAGGRLLWESPIEGLRLGGSLQVLQIDAKLLSNAKFVNVEIPAVLAVGSVEYAVRDLVLTAEYSRWYTKVQSSDPNVFPSIPTTISERAYAMATYRFETWLQPGVYYSLLFPDVDHRDGRANRQHDLAATLRFDVNLHWLVKLEGHFMSGTAGLNTSLNNDTPRSALDRYWGVFLAKTTGYF